MYNEELGREQSTAEIVGGILLLAVTVTVVWTFLNWASE